MFDLYRGRDNTFKCDRDTIERRRNLCVGRSWSHTQIIRSSDIIIIILCSLSLATPLTASRISIPLPQQPVYRGEPTLHGARHLVAGSVASGAAALIQNS